MQNLVEFMEKEVEESSLELIRHIVNVAKGYQGRISLAKLYNPMFKSNAMFAVSAVNRVNYETLSREDRSSIDYLLEIVKPEL